MLKAELGDRKIEVAAIGPAGEKLVRLAAIMNMANRANGRTGMGAVMGSKNLKAVVVRGTNRKVPMADAAALGKLAKWGSKEIPNNGDVLGLRNNGTEGVLEGQHAAGGLPTFNYNAGQFERLRGDLRRDDDRDDPQGRATPATPAPCAASGSVETEWRGPAGRARATAARSTRRRPLRLLLRRGRPARHRRWPTRSATSTAWTRSAPGATIAWAMDCFEHGVLSEAEIGFPAPFGDAEAMVRLAEMIAAREGFGDVLANGSRKAADLLGKGHEHLITVKGAEAPAHMPQAKRSLGVIYAVNPFGADHQSSEHDPMIEEGACDLYMERLKLLGFDETLPYDSLGPGEGPLRPEDPAVLLVPRHRRPVPVRVGPGLDAVRAAGGGRRRAGRHRLDDFDLDELMEIGERRLNMLRAFNAREGIDRSGRQAARRSSSSR